MLAPVSGETVALEEAGDPVFASGALGAGLGIVPTDGTILAPVTGELVTVADTGHAFGLRTDDGVEVLVHVGVDTVRLGGEGFTVDVSRGQRVTAGDRLGTVDLVSVQAAGLPTTTLVTVTNSQSLPGVTAHGGGTVRAGDVLLDIER
ncbi:PTS sugar transporter subunit IIA [Cellulomonas denverensis]|uniref:PTS sugar transporter subunit IIA n=1 Tax=Cellulomonas denverensis TaxID=264297 RepID=UPI0035EA636A